MKGIILSFIFILMVFGCESVYEGQQGYDPADAIKTIPDPPSIVKSHYIGDWPPALLVNEGGGKKIREEIDYSFEERVINNIIDIRELYLNYLDNNYSLILQYNDFNDFFYNSSCDQYDEMLNHSLTIADLERLRFENNLSSVNDFIFTEEEYQHYNDFYYIIKNDLTDDLQIILSLLNEYYKLAYKISYTKLEIFHDFTGYDNPEEYNEQLSKHGIYSRKRYNVKSLKTKSGIGAEEAIIKLNDILDKLKNASIIENFRLSQNYPNPFNNSTIIKYYLPLETDVKIIIYDVIGRKIFERITDKQLEGNYSFKWEGSSNKDELISSGVYFYSIVTNYKTLTKSMILIK